MPGYSPTLLPKKLGIKPNHRVALLGDANDAAHTGELTRLLMPMPDGVELRTDIRGTRPFDLVLYLTTRRAEMARRVPALAARLTTAGMVWLGWPKKASGVATDLSDGAVRAIGLEIGLVDNKTCAITDVWSGLRFVRRLKDR